jgi:dihydroorotate dehydrogenase
VLSGQQAAVAGRRLRDRTVDLGYRQILRPALFGSYRGDAERVHQQTLTALSWAARSRPLLRTLAALTALPQSPVTVAGITFPGVVGLAAGMDKDGVGVKAWSALGFGHAELGTVTALAQPGSDSPRLFRLRQSQAILNRMGFNNAGARALADRLAAAGVLRGNNRLGMRIGISIGKTKAAPLAEATQDYLTSLRLLAPFADYLAINVSSPNTPGLRSLQDREALAELVSALVAETRSLAGHGTAVPLFVKIAPDLTEAALQEVLAVCLENGVQGLIATNTTVPVIGVGGILTRADASAMLDAGASLLQVYTGFVYRGPALVSEINSLASTRSRRQP